MTGARVLFLSEKLPLPIRGGRDMRVWPHVIAAARQGAVAVFGLHPQPPAPPPLHGIDVWCSSADPTLTRALSGPEALQWLRDPKASPADQYLTETSAREVDEILGTFRPDVAVLEGVFLHRYIPLLLDAGCRLVVDCHNVEATLEHDVASLTTPHEKLIRRKWAERLHDIENDTLAAADRIWATSDVDAGKLVELYKPAAPVTVVPNAVDVESYPEAHGNPLDLVFPASFGSVANNQAAGFLVDDVLPLLARTCGPKQQPRLTLVGARPPAELTAMATIDPRVVVPGVVDDIRPFLADAGAMPIPLMAGSGTRFKALEAFASQLPVVSTAIGVDGLEVVDGVHYLKAESAAEFVDQLLRLRDPAVRAPIAAAARHLVEERYSWTLVTRLVMAELGLL